MSDVDWTTTYLPYTGAYDVEQALLVIRAHAVSGGEVTDPEGRSHLRLVRYEDRAVAVRVRWVSGAVAASGEHPSGQIRGDEHGEHHDQIEVSVSDRAAAATTVTKVRHWLDLDADLDTINSSLSRDPVLRDLVQKRPGLRVMRYPEPFEAAVLTVIGQQISLAAGRTFAGRLLAAYGTPTPYGLVAFPTAEELAAVAPEDLQRTVGLTGARASTLHTLAVAVAEGLEIDPDGDHAQIRKDLLALRGIGPWTADYVAVRVLGDPDAFPPGDLVLRRALGGVDTTHAAGRAERWRPYRAYALFHLWSEGLEAGPAKRSR